MKTQLRLVVCMLFLTCKLSVAWAQTPVATVRLDSVWACPGQVVEVPLRVFGVSELGLNTFYFTFRLNTAILEPVLLSQNEDGTQGFPSITAFNDELAQRGSFVANFDNSEILITWIDRAPSLPSLTLEDGSVLFSINVVARGQLVEPEPIDIRIATISHQVWLQSVAFQVNKENGHVLAKSAPDVRIDRTFFDNPRYSQLEWPVGNPSRWSDITLCVDEPFQLKATGAERFEWRSVSFAGAGSNTLPGALSHLVLDRTDVYNPVFIGRSVEWFRDAGFTWMSAPVPIWQYHIEVRGYNSDGCFGTDTVRIWMDYAIRHPLVDQPTHIVIERGQTIDLALELEPPVGVFSTTFANEHYWAPQIIRWFPHDLIQDPKQVVERFTDRSNSRLPRSVTTRTGPIHESTWIWAEIRQLPVHIADTSFARALNTRQGCVQFLNIRVDIRDEMFDARISAMNPENLEEYDYFCGTPGVTEQRTMLAALVEGGSGERLYKWEFRPLHTGLEPFIADTFANPTEITFFGTTEVSVLIVDVETGQEIFLQHTLVVETPKTLSVNIAMDEASQRFYEMGFCDVHHMPLTLLATVDNQGAFYQVFWEETRPVHTPDGTFNRTYRVHGMEGNVARFPQARAGAVYRAVVESSDRCVTQHTVWSNIIDPRSEWFAPSAVILDEIHNSGCNTTPINLVFRAVNVGEHPLFHIYRNGELIDSFDSIITNPNPFHTGFIRQVESQNYWDRFSIRFTNQSAQCLRLPSVMSQERFTNAHTTRYLSAGNIVSVFGGYDVCNTTEGIFTFRLENMAQFGRDATVIWKINGTEWGRYEFNSNFSDAEAQRPPNPILLNEILRMNDTTPFTEAEAFLQGFPFHLNAPGFPKIGEDFFEGDVLSVLVVSRVMCGASANGIVDSEASVTPRFITQQPANLILAGNLDVCTGDDIVFTASLENMNPNAGVMRWFLNGQRVGEGTTFTLQHALNNDEVSVLFESNFACAPNLPLRETRVVTAHDLPTLAVIADSIVCVGESLELLAETNATAFLWTGNNLSSTTVRNPVATPSGVNTPHDFTVTVTNDGGCQSTATVTVRTAPKTAVTANIWLERPQDTAVCRSQLLLIRSEYAPTAGANVEHVWLRNGLATNHTNTQLATSTNRDRDVWQLQVSMPNLNTCLPRVALSNPIEIRVDALIEVPLVLALDPRHHQNACEDELGTYLFLATSPTSLGQSPRFDWFINDRNVGFQKYTPLLALDLVRGDNVHVVLTGQAENCQRLTATSNAITILAGPTMPTIDGHMICLGETTTLTIENPQDNQTYRWYSSLDYFQNAVVGTTRSNASIATYRVVVTAENNCERAMYVDVEQGVQPQARITLLTPPSEVRSREPIRFRNDARNWTLAYWHFGEKNSDWQPLFGGIVEHTFDTIQRHVVALHVISEDGCEATYELALDVQPSMTGIFVPTAFMPNSPDPRNSYLRVFATNENPISSLRFTVFAMDGRELFTTNNPSEGWNGRYNGSDMPTGNYSWMVSARLSSGEEVVRSGVTTLVR